jgi:hypothetical protein
MDERLFAFGIKPSASGKMHNRVVLALSFFVVCGVPGFLGRDVQAASLWQRRRFGIPM